VTRCIVRRTSASVDLFSTNIEIICKNCIDFNHLINREEKHARAINDGIIFVISIASQKSRRSGLSRRDSERGQITLLTRLYDLATMSNHGYNICDISGRIFFVSRLQSAQSDPAISCFFRFKLPAARFVTSKPRRFCLYEFEGKRRRRYRRT